MTEVRMDHNENCTDAHDKHLCYLMYEGFHLSNKNEYKQLVADAQYRCQNCGRTAKDASSLCVPIQL